MAEFLKCLTFDAFWMLTVREFQTENVIHFNVLNKRAEEVKKAISKFNLATQLACVRACVRACVCVCVRVCVRVCACACV